MFDIVIHVENLSNGCALGRSESGLRHVLERALPAHCLGPLEIEFLFFALEEVLCIY
jgi:hypothetical protein